MFERHLVQPNVSWASVTTVVAALVLLICSIMLVMPEPFGASDCCLAVRSVHPPVPNSLPAVLAPTILVTWLFAVSLAVSRALDRRLPFPGPRALRLLC